jgi:hypothetical protein
VARDPDAARRACTRFNALQSSAPVRRVTQTDPIALDELRSLGEGGSAIW